MNPAVSPLCGVDELDTPFRLKMLGRFRGDEELFDIATAIEATFAGDPELARPLPDLKKNLTTPVPSSDLLRQALQTPDDDSRQ